MRKHKMIACLSLMFSLLAGLIPCQPVKAGLNFVNTPKGDGSNYTVYGEAYDALTEKVKDSNFNVNNYDMSAIDAHLDNYAKRLAGLSALAGSGDSVAEYSNVIGLADMSDAFLSSRGDMSVKIGSNTVTFDLDDKSSAQFLHRPEVVNKATGTADAYNALCNTVLEYIYYATVFRGSLNAKINNGESFTQDEVNWLGELKEAAEWSENTDDTGTTGVPHYKFIIDLYNTMGEDGDLGLSELYELGINMEVSTVGNSNYELVEPDYAQPLHMFYTIDGGKSVTRVDLFSIASAVSNGLVNGIKRGIDILAGNKNSNDDEDDTENGSTVTETDRGMVTLSEEIVQGISYSSSYIPMQTNLYSAATINKYDQDWLRDFHYKYGFMRKALYKDTSATSAMDYYNSRGTQKGNLKVCTLRDFMELGDNDLVLYVDDDFYNSEEGRSIVEQKTNAAVASYSDFVDDLQVYYDTVFGRDETEESSYVTNEYLLSVYGYDTTQYTSKSDMSHELAQHKKILSKLNKVDSWEAIVKDGDYTSYSNNMRQLINDTNGEYVANADTTGQMELPYGIVADSSTITDVLDGLTSRDEISKVDEQKGYVYTSYDEYSPIFSYAFVSAIYRNEETFKIASLNELDTPVFIASDDVAQVRDATDYDRQSLLNYMLVRNLNSMVQIDYAYSLDMDCPVFIDIYGNIVTQSGIVVIPAASNSTLYPSDYASNIYSAGLFLCYGNDWHVPTSYDFVDGVLGSYFYQDFDNGVWLIAGTGLNVTSEDSEDGDELTEVEDSDTTSKRLVISDGTTQVDYARMSVYNDATYTALEEAFKQYIYSDTPGESGNSTHVIWPKWVSIINEVMRGAPMEHISLDTEELRTNGIINKSSIVAAAKLESLLKSLHSDMANSLLALPDFNRMDHTEYIVAFLLKFLMIAVVTVVLFSIYRDAVGSNLGLRTIWKCLSSVALTVICITTVPMIFQLTYYGANKMLLQKEVTNICMYNLEKSQSGVEIGITETTVPEVQNKLMVQLDYVDVQWYKEWNEMLFGRGLMAVDDARQEAMQDSQLSYLDDTKFYNDGVYMSVDDIYDSVGMDYTFNVGESDGLSTVVNGLYLYDNGTNQTLSFYSPYYVFLTALTSNVNQYNQTHNSYMYTTKTQSGNRVKTVGLCSNYFQSQGFMELDEDILHIKEIYELDKSAYYDTGYAFTPDEILLMSKSKWYNRIDEKGLEKRIEIVNNYCREFIADHRDVLDKVTDETFIKVMALSCAMKYNQVFGISEANCFEIYDLDSNDLLRLCIASTPDAMLTSPMSYSRFVLSIGGEASVYMAAVLEMILYVGSFVKPICILIAYVSVFLSIFVFRVVLRRKSNNLLGYLITVALLSLTNFLHAVIIKLSTYLPSVGLPMLGCLMFIILGQVAYLLFLGYVTGVALRDWYNLGANKYQESLEALKRKRNSKKGDYLNAYVPRYENNWDYYEALVNQHRQRNN